MTRMQTTAEQRAWLASEYRVHRIPELTRRFNQHWGTDYTAAQMKNALNRHKIRAGRAPGFRHGERWFSWSPEMVSWLRQHRADDVIEVVTERLNARFGTAFNAIQVHAAAQRHRISAGTDGKIKAGSVPWNKGLNFNAGGRNPETQFQPGNDPSTTVPIWSLSQDSESYWKMKVRDDSPPGFARRNWEYLHRLTWIAVHGPIPKGHCVILIDGDPENCLDIANLACVSRSELVRLNQLGWRKLRDPALRRSAIELVRLHCAVIDKTRNQPGRKSLVRPLGAFVEV